MDLSEDGSMEVREDIGVIFTESRRGIYRTIPIYSPSWRYTVVENFKAIGDPASYIKEENNYQLKIWDPNVFHFGEKNYHIRYKVKNAIAGFWSEAEAWTELYRNIIGTERETSIDNISFTLNLPKSHTFWSEEYYVVYGKAWEQKTEAIRMIYNEKQHRFEGKLNQKLLDREGVTIGVKFPSDYFTLSQEYLNIQAPTYSDMGENTYIPFGWLLNSIWWRSLFRGFFFLFLGIISIILGIKYRIVATAFVSLHLLIGIFMGFSDMPIIIPLFWNGIIYAILYSQIMRKLKGGDKKNKEKNRPITIYYTPPKGINLITASEIAEIDPKRTLVALIYERAAKGEITIEQIKKRILFFTTKEYLFHKKTFWSGWLVGEIFSKELQEIHKINNYPYNELLEIIFSEQTSKLSELTWNDYQFFLKRLKSKQDNETKKYYTTETKKLLKLISYEVETLNQRGEEIYEEIRGFKHYLSKVESPYLAQMLKEDPLYLDKMLPWAVLLWVETEFLQAVQNHLGQLENPIWYTGEDAFSVIAVGAMTSSIMSRMNPPSEGSGSGWGGSSWFSSGGGSSGGWGWGGGWGSW